jgi:pimeloyl-ACP methyl ester carboxylesterase
VAAEVRRLSSQFVGCRALATTERDIDLDGRVVHVYDTGAGAHTVFWHHGTPNIGAPPAPLFELSARLGVRWISHDRPGYGGSTPVPDRDVASVAGDVAVIADALGIDRFGVMGHSGGGPHALACAALRADRVVAAVDVSGLAPFGADGLDWFAGMAPASAASLRAAAAGRVAKERHEATADDTDIGFTPADEAALAGDWAWLLDVVRPALAAGPGGSIDDDLAYVAPWGFDPATIAVPVLIVHGGQDAVVPSAHGEWLAARVPGADLMSDEADGHISVLRHAPAALEWLADRFTP